MITCGIDLASEPEGTAAATVDWATRRVTVHTSTLDDATLVSLIRASDLSAIDVPLGWPRLFVEAVVAHQGGDGWVPPTRATGWRGPLRHRRTDHVIAQAGNQPLSVSTDRIGSTAMRGAAIQHALILAGGEVDRTGTTGCLAEAYPAAALRAWGLPSKGYKRAKGLDVRRHLVDRLISEAGPLAPSLLEGLHDCSDDVLDAVVCAIVAAAVWLGLTEGPTEDDVVAARSEGWIHVAPAPLGDVIDRALAAP